MNRRSLLRGSRNRNVPSSNCAHSEPYVFTDMQSTSTRELSSPSSISFALREFMAQKRSKKGWRDLFCSARIRGAWAYFPLIEPHAQAVLSQALRDRANDLLVLRAVAEENVNFEVGC